MKRTSRISLVLLALLAVVAGGGALAWACTAQAYITVPESAAAGATVTVEGRGFAEGPIEVRWGSEYGQLLGTAAGPSFATAVTIPDVPDDTYVIVATGSYVDEDGRTQTAIGRDSIAVGEPATRPTDSTVRTTAPEREAAGPGRASITTAGGRAEAGRTLPPVTTAAAPADASQTAAASDVPAPTGTGRATAAPTAASPSERAASGDLRTGFSTGVTGSLLPGLDVPAGEQGPGSHLGLGFALLVAGLATLAAGAATALRRRRATIE